MAHNSTSAELVCFPDTEGRYADTKPQDEKELGLLPVGPT